MINYDYLKKRFLEDELRIYIDSLAKPQITEKISRGFSSGLSFRLGHNNDTSESVIELKPKHIDFLKGKLFKDLK